MAITQRDPRIGGGNWQERRDEYNLKSRLASDLRYRARSNHGQWNPWKYDGVAMPRKIVPTYYDWYCEAEFIISTGTIWFISTTGSRIELWATNSAIQETEMQ